MTEPKYYHGGAPSILRWIEPPSRTRAPSTASYGAAGVCRTDRVYVTTDPNAACIFAAMHPSGRGVVYEVKPAGEIVPDPDCTEAGLSFECERAAVVRAFKFSRKHLALVRKAVLG